MRDDWVETTLGELATAVAPSKANGLVTRYVGLEHFDSGTPRLTRWGSTDDFTSISTAFEPGDVLFSKLRPYLRKVAVANFSGRCTTEALVYRPSEDKVSASYLGLLLQSGAAIHHADASSAGSRMPRTSVRLMANLPVGLPPIPEQRRIVDLIGALDNAIVAVAIAEASAWRVMDHVADSIVEGTLLEMGSRLSEAVRLIDCEHKTAPASVQERFGYSVGTGDVRGGLISVEAAKPISQPVFDKWTARAVPKVGDVVLTREAPPGEVGLITEDLGPIALGQRTVLLQPKPGTHGPYLWALLASPKYRRWMESRTVGQTVRRINVKEILAIPMHLPDEEEQATAADRVRAATDTALSHRAMADRLRTLRTNLLTALLTGEHEIPESYDALLGEAS